MKSGFYSLLAGLFLVSMLSAQAPAPTDPAQPQNQPVPADAKKAPQAPSDPARPGFRFQPPSGSRGALPSGFRPQSAPPASPATPTERVPVERPPAGLSAGAFPRNFPPLPESAEAGKMVMLDILIAETAEPLSQPTAAELLDLSRTGKLKSNARIRLLTMENVPAFTQFGELASKVSGVTATNTRVLPIYNSVNVGTIAQATTRLEPDGSALIQLYVEKSSLVKSNDPPESRVPEAINRILAQSTLRVKPDEPVVLSAGPSNGSDTASHTWIVVQLNH